MFWNAMGTAVTWLDGIPCSLSSSSMARLPTAPFAVGTPIFLPFRSDTDLIGEFFGTRMSKTLGAAWRASAVKRSGRPFSSAMKLDT